MGLFCLYSCFHCLLEIKVEVKIQVIFFVVEFSKFMDWLAFFFTISTIKKWLFFLFSRKCFEEKDREKSNSWWWSWLGYKEQWVLVGFEYFFMVKKQEKILQKAMKRQENVSREVKKIIKWANLFSQFPVRYNFWTT